MPLFDLTNNRKLPLHLVLADTPLARMVGLLGKPQATEDEILHIVPCKSVHSFGMQFPIDIVALNKEGEVIERLIGWPRNKTVRFPRAVHSILEGAHGWAEKYGINNGQRLRLITDEKHKVNLTALRHLFHWPLNFIIALLWSRLVWYLFHTWQQNQSAMTLGVLIHNTILFILFLFRRESTDTSQRVWDWLVPFATLTCAMLLRPVAHAAIVPLQVSFLIQGIGISCMVFSLLSLGRSFGIVPAHRQLRLSGAYRLVRHPLYTSELIFFLGFLFGNFSYRNAVLFAFILFGQWFRSIAEERLLAKDDRYAAYMQSVRYRFLPGLY